eukprot:CAMPEP_0119148232 /NCGR_PEP_ID=MMETSP1310-20130426/41530_1 /TAXON_ID=464262 /ORGANISM="Genus nov. species nov., Strain RCC2339" /LENGTH=319 /DNA_ID=CAMNT_0007140257 /DNA_START=1 /DNA_END=960 /DNA_ORIENTATION=+
MVCSHELEKRAELEDGVEVVMGIDEAGRGPVLGPLVYACAYWPIGEEVVNKKMGFADSKRLKEEDRDRLFADIKAKPGIGFKSSPLSPKIISHSMLQLSKYNLNELSQDTAIELVAWVAKQANLRRVYVDAVGNTSKFRERILSRFPDLDVTVTEKADSKFAVVSAASICAKVTRDDILARWQFEEGAVVQADAPMGSGYPSDPRTKQWLTTNFDHVFGFPSIVRFSWSTCSTILKRKAIRVDWGTDDEDDDNANGPDRKRRKLASTQSEGSIHQHFAKTGTSASTSSKEKKKTLSKSFSAELRSSYFSVRQLALLDDF